MAETFLFEIVTPARLALSCQAECVIIPGGAGHFGVLPGHAEMLSTVDAGTIELRDKSLKILDSYFVEGGFAEVTPERCTVLAEVATPLQEITRDDAEDRVKRAHDALMVSQALHIRVTAEHDLRTAEAMLAAVDQYERQGTH
ncbi:MAG: ATP synthase F1 subunit epsilon [Defluviicoccus sp.]